MLLLVCLFCLAVSIPIYLKKEKHRRRVDAVLRDVKKWKEQVSDLEKVVHPSDLDAEKLEMSQNRLTFAKNAYRIR